MRRIGADKTEKERVNPPHPRSINQHIEMKSASGSAKFQSTTKMK
jgi:hypothetical protein